MILVIDNYDSFTYNLVHQLSAFAQDVTVVRNDEVDLKRVKAMAPAGIVISPGPGHPANPDDFGACIEIIRGLDDGTPILGVCLGHEGIVQAFGGKVEHARQIVHGKPSSIEHDGRGVFANVPNPMKAIRYHSLVAVDDGFPDRLEVSARADGEIMAVRHRDLPIEGVQFHPESIGTRDGDAIAKNFVELTHGRRT